MDSHPEAALEKFAVTEGRSSEICVTGRFPSETMTTDRTLKRHGICGEQDDCGVRERSARRPTAATASVTTGRLPGSDCRGPHT